MRFPKGACLGNRIPESSQIMVPSFRLTSRRSRVPFRVLRLGRGFPMRVESCDPNQIVIAPRRQITNVHVGERIRRRNRSPTCNLLHSKIGYRHPSPLCSEYRITSREGGHYAEPIINTPSDNNLALITDTLASHLEIRKKPMEMRIKVVDSVTKWHNKRENNNVIDYYLDGSGVDQFSEEDASTCAHSYTIKE